MLLTVLLAAQALECGITPARVSLGATAYRLLVQNRMEACLAMWAVGPVGDGWRDYVRATDQADLLVARASTESSDGIPGLDTAWGLLRDQARTAANDVVSAARLRDAGLPAIGDLVIVLPDWNHPGPVTPARIVTAMWRSPANDADVMPDRVDSYEVQATEPRSDSPATPMSTLEAVRDILPNDAHFHPLGATGAGWVPSYNVLLDTGPDDARHHTVGATQARIVGAEDLLVTAHALEDGWPTGTLLADRLPHYARWPDIHTAVTDAVVAATTAGGAICRTAADRLTSPP